MIYRTISFVIILLFSFSIFATINTGMLGKRIATAIAAIAPNNKATLLPNSINSTEEKKFQSHSGIPNVEISKDIAPFSQGTIDYETRIDKGYRGSTSSHISLLTANRDNHLSLAIYHNDSSYTPNGYLLSYNDNKGKSHFDQRPLNQTIEYGKWYKVRLKINSTAISFYFDGKPITTLSRLTDSSDGSSNSSNAYTSIHLIGESAAVSFKNMIIQQNNQFSDLFDHRNNLFYWRNFNNVAKFKQESNGADTTVSLLPVNDEPADLTHSFIEITKGIDSFKYGTLEYQTRIDKGYGGPTSSSVSLFTANRDNHLSLAIYHNDSSYTPNSYLLLQSDNKGKSHFDQRPLNQTIEYGKWYKVRLKINSTAISFYFDGKPITTLSKLAGSSNGSNSNSSNSNAYTSIHLGELSSAVSFKNMIIQQNNQSSDLFDYRNNNSLFGWKIINSGPEKAELKLKRDIDGSNIVMFPPIVNSTVLVPLRDDLNSAPKIIGDSKLKVETVFQGISFPTTMAFLGPNDILVLEKEKGTVQRIVNGKMLPTPLLRVNVAYQFERGMLGIAVSKNTPGHTYVFLYYTEAEKKNSTIPIANRLYRYELINNKLVNQKLLLSLPATPGATHNGGVVKIGPDNNIYAVIGDNDVHHSQSENFKDGPPPDGTGGILRITQDGKPVKGILGDNFPLNLYYAYGIRNSFGMDFDPLTGRLWDTENGPANNDEINLVEPGFNSGWSVTQGENMYRDNPDGFLDFNGKGKYSPPEFTWYHTVAPTALAFLHSNKLGRQYENDIFIGDVNHGRIYHFKLDENRTGLVLKGPIADKVADTDNENENIIFAAGFGAITDLEVGPDGYLYVVALGRVSVDQGAIYKIVPSAKMTQQMIRQ
jgi:glucose/arabinose dehydrogenase